MKKIPLNQLKGHGGGTVFGDLVSGRKVVRGGVHVFKPGEVAHADQERHVHEIEEIFRDKGVSPWRARSTMRRRET